MDRKLRLNKQTNCLFFTETPSSQNNKKKIHSEIYLISCENEISFKVQLILPSKN